MEYSFFEELTTDVPSACSGVVIEKLSRRKAKLLRMQQIGNTTRMIFEIPITNMRASGSDEAINLTPPIPLTIERGLEIMRDDEYLEVTPKNIRLRKQILKEQERLRAR